MGIPHISPGARNVMLGMAGIGGLVLAACSSPNDGESPTTITRSIFDRYDRGQKGSSSAAADGFLELGTETQKDYWSTNSVCEVGYYYDDDGDGISDDWYCSVERHDHYLETYSVDRIARDADLHGPDGREGQNDGFAYEGEVSQLISDTFDVGYTDKKGNLVGAGDGKLTGAEADKFDEAYSSDAETRISRVYDHSTYTYWLDDKEHKADSLDSARDAAGGAKLVAPDANARAQGQSHGDHKSIDDKTEAHADLTSLDGGIGEGGNKAYEG